MRGHMFRLNVLRLWCGLAVSGLMMSAVPGRAAEFRPGDTAVVVQDNVEFGVGDRVLARLRKGSRLKVTEERGSWVGGYQVDDPQKDRAWVHESEVKLILRGPMPAGADEARAVSALLAANVRVDVDGQGHVYEVRPTEPFADAVLANLADLEHLVVLDLSGSKAGDAALAHVGKATSLEILYLEGTAVTDDGLRHLQPLAKLEVLVLAGTQVTGKGLEQLRPLVSLRTLNLSHCRIQDADLKHLSAFQAIEVLTLSHTPLAGDGLVHLRPLRNLRVLNLDDTGVKDPGLKHLAGMPSLKMLYLKGTGVTSEGTTELDQTLTSCAIYR